MVRKPLYQQAADLIRREFIDGRPSGFRLPSELRLAELLGVSLITVRGALRELGDQGLLERRRGSGTYVVERLPSGKHAAILLDVDLAAPNLSPFYIKWLRLLQDAFREEGIPHRPYLGSLPLGIYPSENISCLELLEDVRLDRISAIFGIYVSQKPFWGQRFVSRGIPVLDSTHGSERTWESCLRSVLAHFQQRNRKRLAIIGWEHPLDGLRPLSKAFFRLAPEYGIEPAEIPLALDANGWEHGMGWERIRDLWRSSVEKRDALLIADDMLFDDCQKALSELGISIPRDLEVAVSTSDAHRFSEIRFPVFAWRANLKSQARMMAIAIKRLISGQAPPDVESVSFTPEVLQPEGMEMELPLLDQYAEPVR